MGSGERDSENRVRAESALRRCAVEGDERRIKGALIADRRAVERLCDFAVHRSDGAEDPFAAEATLVAIAKLNSFVCASRCARWNSGATSCTTGKRYIYFNGRVAARVKDLAPLDCGDAVAHARVSLSSSSSADGLTIGFGFAGARFAADLPPGFTGET